MPQTPDSARFLVDLALCEASLQQGLLDRGLDRLVSDMRHLVAESDSVASLLCDSDSLALRFDSVVNQWKLLQGREVENV